MQKLLKAPVVILFPEEEEAVYCLAKVQVWKATHSKKDGDSTILPKVLSTLKSSQDLVSHKLKWKAPISRSRHKMWKG